MACDIGSDGRVAIVPGTGRGLRREVGREYALGLASRAAQVLVNNLGLATTPEPVREAWQLIGDRIGVRAGEPRTLRPDGL